MATKKENLKALFSNTRSRVIIIFTTTVLVVAVSVGVFKLLAEDRDSAFSSAAINIAPGNIQSIPGALDQTAQYASLQAEQNNSQATQAMQTGGSAIPTIIRAQAFGQGVNLIGAAKNGEGSLGFSGLSLAQSAGPQNPWVISLQNGNCSKQSIQTALSQGATFVDLKTSCSCTELKTAGYALSNLNTVCSCEELKTAGFNVEQLKADGYDAEKLRRCGFDACDLRHAKFTAAQVADGGYSNGELKGAGFSDGDINNATGLPPGITAQDVLDAHCQPQALSKLRLEGVTAGAIRRIAGCSAKELQEAGYGGQNLRDAGFSAATLKNAGDSASDLKQAGFGPRDLLNAGFLPTDLTTAGYTPGQIAAGETELPPGVNPLNIREAGCSEKALKRERLAGISALLIREYAGCSLRQLKNAGFSDASLENAGFTPQEIDALDGPTSDAAIREAGCNVSKLHALFEAGVSAARIQQLNGCSAATLRDAGYHIPNEQAIQDAGCDPIKLRELHRDGDSASLLREKNNCGLDALKAAGFDAKSIANAGFSPQDMLNAGFTPQQMNHADLGPIAVIAAGRTENCSVSSLRAARLLGVSATTIRLTLGCSASAMKAAGFTAAQLRAAGYTAAELRNAGFNIADLRGAGFAAKELKDSGYQPNELTTAGYTPPELRESGVSASDLRKAGTTLPQLKSAGYAPDELKAAGFTNEESGLASSVPAMPSANLNGNLGQTGPGWTLPELPGTSSKRRREAAAETAENKRLQEIMSRQEKQMARQRYQQKIQDQTNKMIGAANQDLQKWKMVSTQVFVEGSATQQEQPAEAVSSAVLLKGAAIHDGKELLDERHRDKSAIIKVGDILFAVMDTAVDSDEPGPVLATIVSGPLKGGKLIGTFNLAANADKMAIIFHTLSMPGAVSSVSVNAYAIDPDTARTALSSSTNHHYLERYGALFASSFIEGFGNAFQSANTTITIGGEGQASNTTVQSGVGRSILENAVIGLSTVGKSWGQFAQQQFNRPTTVRVCSGTGVGVLFMQDVTSI